MKAVWKNKAETKVTLVQATATRTRSLEASWNLAGGQQTIELKALTSLKASGLSVRGEILPVCSQLKGFVNG